MLTVIFLMMSLAFGFTSCGTNDDETNQVDLTIVDQLPYYSVEYNDAELLNVEDIETKVHIVNSEDEMKDLFGDKFLEVYPQYASIDFSQYSAIVATTKMISDISNIKFKFLECQDTIIPIYYRLQLSYNMDSEIHPDHYIVVFGVIVDKLSSDAIVLLC